MNKPVSEESIRRAAETAASRLTRANALLTAEEKGVREQMLRLLTHPGDKVVRTKMIDQSVRSRDPARARVWMKGRIELPHDVINQSICDSIHRWPNRVEKALLVS